MEMQNDITANAQPIAPEIHLDRKALVPAVKLIASLVERRNTVPILSCILITSDGETATLTATDLDTMATFRLQALARSLPFRAAVPAAELARLVAKLDKSRDDVSLSIDRGRVLIVCGKARFHLAMIDPDGFPTIADAGEIERDAWQCTADEAATIDPRIDGLAAPEKVGKLFAKARKLIGDGPVEMTTWTRDDNPRMEMTAGPLAMRFKLGEAAQMLREPRASKFRYNNAPSDDAAITAYLIGLAQRYGLDMSGQRHAVTYGRDGLAMGMAFGKSEWIRGERVEIVDYETLTTHYEMTEGREVWADGSYCVVMPRADQAAVTLQRMGEDGEWSEPVPVRTDSAGRLEWEAIGALPDLFGSREDWSAPAVEIEAAPPAVEKSDEPACQPEAAEATTPLTYMSTDPAAENTPPAPDGVFSDPLDALAARVAKLEAIIRGGDQIANIEPETVESCGVEVVTKLQTNVLTSALPPYPNARTLAGAFSFGASNQAAGINTRARRLRIVRRYLAIRTERDAAQLSDDTRRADAEELYSRAYNAEARAEDAEFRLSDLAGRVEKAEARALAAEAMAAPALDKAQARIVALETEVARLRPRLAMSGPAVHAMLYGARGKAPAVANA